ncbi:hypothetical protein CO083_03925, partial [Candidatus Roizmanbacteria bacterium CG_4_9_14_0_8_um_filter_34_12]
LDIISTKYYYIRMLYQQSISARQMQREYKTVFDCANKEKTPVVVFAHNKPLGAVIGLELLEKLQMDTILKEALQEYKKGKTRTISDAKELEQYLAELDK